MMMDIKETGAVTSHEGTPPQTNFFSSKVNYFVAEKQNLFDEEPELRPDEPQRPMMSLNAEIEPQCYGLSDEVVKVIDSVCRGYRVPRDFVIAPMLAVASGAIGSKVKVQWKQYENNLNIFAFIVAYSGDQKSAPCKRILSPLKGINRVLYTKYREAYEAALTAYNSDPKGRKKDKPDLSKFPTRQVIISDTTPEARYKALKDNPHGLLLYADELNGIFENMGRYNKGGEKTELLSTYDGEDIIINRKGQGAEIIESPFLSMLGGIQPEVLRNSFDSPDFIDSGFLPRASLFYPVEYEEGFYEDNPSAINDGLWCETVERLYHNLPQLNLSLCEEAEAAYKEFYNYIVLKRRETSRNTEKSVLAKLRINVFKIAGIGHCINMAARGDYSSDKITLHEMCWAIDMMHYFLTTQKRVMGLMRNGTRDRGISGVEVARYIREVNPSASFSQIAEILGLNKSTVCRYLKK